MTVDAESSYRYLGTGVPLAVEVSGPSVEECLVRAVEGFMASFADVHPSIVPTDRPFELDAASPASVLAALLEACVRSAEEGDIPVTASNVRLEGGRLVGALATVPAAAASLHIGLPATVAWQRVTLERHGGHWLGRIVADL